MRLSNQKKYIHVDRDELYELFIVQNKTRKECAEHFKCSEATIKKKCKIYGISKSSKSYVENTQKTLMDKYGTNELWNISNDKRIKTNIERYGVEKPFQSQSIQDSIAEKRRDYFTNEEKIIKDVLDKNSIEYIKEYPVMINGKNNYFDFCVSINNEMVLIEVDGVFHVKNIFRDETLERSIKEEQIKNEYCFNNNIKLVRIPYFITKEQKENIILNIISPD